MSYFLNDYDYGLPEEHIAQQPVIPAHNSKLLHITLNTNTNMIQIHDYHCRDLPQILPENTLLIANNSQVYPSRIKLNQQRIILSNGQETILDTGEIFIVRLLIDDQHLLNQQRCIIRGSDKKHFKPGSIIYRTDTIWGKSEKFVEDGIVRSLHGTTLDELCRIYGEYPLPPYIYTNTQENQDRYKLSFGKVSGSVATPTAGLHFSPELRSALVNNKIKREEITLHVGIGTFAPIVSDDIRQHRLHSETITISLALFETIYQHKIAHKPIITIGTTSTRTIESLPYLWTLLSTQTKKQYSDACRVWRDQITSQLTNADDFLLIISHNSTNITLSSSLYIYPGYKRTIIDGIITNFHLPKTSLVVLVAGLLGFEGWKTSYQHALDHNYRFASFGDAMLITFS